MEEIEDTVDQVIAENRSVAKDCKSGDDDAINYLIGCVLKETSGSVDPSKAQALLEERLVEQTVEVTIPYDDYYNTNEKISEIENIPSTQAAYDTFRFCPRVEITFEWDKKDQTLSPLYAKIGGEVYELEPADLSK